MLGDTRYPTFRNIWQTSQNITKTPHYIPQERHRYRNIVTWHSTQYTTIYVLHVSCTREVTIECVTCPTWAVCQFSLERTKSTRTKGRKITGRSDPTKIVIIVGLKFAEFTKSSHDTHLFTLSPSSTNWS